MLRFASLVFFLLLLLPSQVVAVCPACVVAVASGAGICSWLGIDDTIVGTWIGALVVASAVWLLSWLDKKNVRFPFRRIFVFASFYFILFFPLYLQGLVGNPYSTLFGVDKFVLGVTIGSLMIALGFGLHLYLRLKKGLLFPFQKVVLPLLLVLAATTIFYFLTC